MLSILTLKSADSIRFLYWHFLSKITDKSLNAFYYACSYVKVNYSRFLNITASMTLKLIPKSLQTHPVFLCMDDTIAPKFWKNFGDVSKLFNHAAHNGSHYLNGHCFISVMLCVLVWDKDKTVYQSASLSYHMWEKKDSKLELTASMIRQVMSELRKKKNVILLCDSWYTKSSLLSVIDEYPNLDMVRSRKVIEMLVNLSNIAYCAMKLLPYQDKAFSKYHNKSYKISGLHSVRGLGRRYLLPLS